MLLSTPAHCHQCAPNPSLERLATAAAAWPLQGTLYIVLPRPSGACRSERLNSNVRPQEGHSDMLVSLESPDQAEVVALIAELDALPRHPLSR
jgi:hypothetical protein